MPGLRAIAAGVLLGLAYQAGARQRKANELERATRWYALGAEDAFEALNDLPPTPPQDAPGWITAGGPRAREHYVAQLRNARTGQQ